MRIMENIMFMSKLSTCLGTHELINIIFFNTLQKYLNTKQNKISDVSDKIVQKKICIAMGIAVTSHDCITIKKDLGSE